MRFSRIVLFIFSIFLISCGAQQNRTPALGQAFVGPNTLLLHQDLNPKSPGTASVHHGEPLDIVEYKRRFVKVRTAGGIEGWTDTRQLLSPEQMTDLQRVARQTARYPSQGTATTLEVVNVHTEPSRTSPGFLQIPEGGKVEVIGHRVTPRTQVTPPLPPPPPKQRLTRRKSKERSNSAKIPLPPMPPAPRLPPHWQELSKTRLPGSERDGESAGQNSPAAAPVPTEDWNLVRATGGQVGWVLSRMLNMAIPEEVAQYAEGHRITSYFAMGDVHDENQLKHNWLWTTMRKASMPYEFDNFRFFIWSRRHHRYETVYIERDVIGHFPVEVDTSGANPAFALILEDDSGNLWRKKYVFNGYRVNKVDTSPFAAPKREAVSAPVLALNKNEESRAQSWYSNMKQKISSLFRR